MAPQDILKFVNIILPQNNINFVRFLLLNISHLKAQNVDISKNWPSTIKSSFAILSLSEQKWNTAILLTTCTH